MIDHMGIAASDFDASRRFYEAALAPLGIGLMMEVTPEETGRLSRPWPGQAGQAVLLGRQWRAEGGGHPCRLHGR